MFITAFGLDQLKNQLASLKAELERTIDERAKAAAEGDLRENSAYIFLTERSTVLHTQISQIEDEIRQAQIQSAPTQTDIVAFGHTLDLHFTADNRRLTLTLVGKHDARLKPGWVSIESPLGQAVLGKRPGDTVDVNDQPVVIKSISVAQV